MNKRDKERLAETTRDHCRPSSETPGDQGRPVETTGDQGRPAKNPGDH